MTRQIMITGVGGFIGRGLARFFARRGVAVYGVGSHGVDNAPVGDLKSYHQMRLPDADFGALVASVRPDLLIHCAGSASVPHSVTDPRTDFLNGPVLTWEVLDAIRLYAPACKFVFLSSAAVYGCPERLPVCELDPGRPISPYGSHKLQSEAICREFHDLFGIQTVSARIFSVYGPGLRRQVVWDLCHKAIKHRRVEAQGTGRESRDFLHVQDLCEALALLEQKAPLQGGVFNIGSGCETSIKNLADSIVQSLGIDCEVAFSGRLPAGTPLNWRADISALRGLGFEPKISMQKGISDYVEWCKVGLGCS